MMMRLMIGTALIASMANVAKADSIVGNWKYEKQVCASGAPAKDPSNQGITMKIDGTLAIDASTIDSLIKLFIKMDAAQAAQTIQQIDQAIAQVQKMPESQEKQDNLKQLQDAKAQVQQLAAGKQCSSIEKMSYTAIDAKTIQTKVLSMSSDCDGSNSSEVGKVDTANVEASATELKVSGQPETSGDGSCAQGDTVITVFSRQ